VAMPLGVVERIQIGYQEGFFANLWSCGGSMLGLLGLIVAISQHAGLPWLILAVSGGPALIAIANGATLFGFQRPWLRPRLADASAKALRRISVQGVYFFALQVAVVIAYSSDNLVTARVLGAQAVAQYSVPFRLFTIPWLVLSTALSPLWPAYGEAIARGDAEWVRRTLFRSIKWSLICSCVASFFLVIFGRRILFCWAGPDIHPSVSLLVGLGVWTVCGTVGNAVSIFLNGMGILRFQAIIGILMALCNLALSIELARAWGVAGVIWGTVFAYLGIVVLPMFYVLPKLLKRVRTQPQASSAYDAGSRPGIPGTLTCPSEVPEAR
jgi:O-antigen/teichoic acid export membrane protein